MDGNGETLACCRPSSMTLVASTYGRAVGLELGDVGLLPVPVVGRPVPVDLVQDALHRRRRHRVHDEDQGVGLAGPDLRHDPLGQPVELADPVLDQRVDGDLAEQLLAADRSGRRSGRAAGPAPASGPGTPPGPPLAPAAAAGPARGVSRRYRRRGTAPTRSRPGRPDSHSRARRRAPQPACAAARPGTGRRRHRSRRSGRRPPTAAGCPRPSRQRRPGSRRRVVVAALAATVVGPVIAPRAP